MSAPTLLATDPEALYEAARALRASGQELDALTAHLHQLQPVTSTFGWRGLAALQQSAQTEALQGLLARAAAPAPEAAMGLERCALAATDGRSQVLRLLDRVDLARIERHRLMTVPAPLEPVERSAWQERIRYLEDEIAGCRSAIAAAEEDFRRLQESVARAVHDAWDRAHEVIGHATVLTQVAIKGLGLKGRGALLRVTAPYALETVRARRVGDGSRVRAVRRLARTRLRDHLQKGPKKAVVDRLPERLRGVGRVVSRATPGLTMIDAFQRIGDGGGYGGARGDVTRGLAVGAFVGVPALILGAPVVALAGVVAVSAYTAWMTGNWIFDNRGLIVEAGKAVDGMFRRVRRWGRAGLRRGLRGVRDVSLRAARRLRKETSLLRQIPRLVPRLQPPLREIIARGWPRIRVPALPVDLPRLPVVAPGPGVIGDPWVGRTA